VPELKVFTRWQEMCDSSAVSIWNVNEPAGHGGARGPNVLAAATAVCRGKPFMFSGHATFGQQPLCIWRCFPSGEQQKLCSTSFTHSLVVFQLENGADVCCQQHEAYT